MKKILFYLTSAVIFTATFTACTAEITTLPAGVMLDQSSITISPGESFMLTAELFPDEAVIKTVSWSSSNPAVATVVNGMVTAIAEGKATIAVTTNSGQKMTACEVTVAYPVSGVVLDKASALLPFGQNLRLTATVMPEDVPDKTVTWISSDPEVATVANGVVTAKAAGTTIISVITGVGNRIAHTTVKVLPENVKIITMILQSFEFVSFSMSGMGNVDIDWDDYEIDSYSSMSMNYAHHYNYISLPRKVTIAGEHITRLNCNANRISGLDVSKCTTLITLDCSDNLLTSLDLSNNIALTELNCSGNQLTGLNVKNNTALTDLNCYNNQLTGLDVSNNATLKNLNCYNNLLTGLDMSNNTALKNLNCYSNLLTGLDMSNNTALADLNCSDNQLTSLDVSNNAALTSFDCRWNQLTDLDVSNNIALTILDCSNNELTNLIVDGNVSLKRLVCHHNKLSVHVLDDLFDMLPIVQNGFLDVRNNPGEADCNKSIAEDKGWALPAKMFLTLQGGVGDVNICIIGSGEVEIDWDDGTHETSDILISNHNWYSHGYFNGNSYTITITGESISSLYCRSIRLTSLDVSKNTALRELDCYNNMLTSLDLSKNTALYILECSNNQLTNLDMSNITWIQYLYCRSNLLSGEALNALFKTLPEHNLFKIIHIYGNPGLSVCDQSIAASKGWWVYIDEW